MQKTLAERQKQIDAQRAKAQEIAKKAFETEEISRANKAYIDASFSAMTSDEDMSKTVEKARLEYQKTLKKYGFCEEDFESKPSCPLCNDTGYVDGKVCSCVWDLFIKNLKEECQIDRRAKFSFEDCDLSKIKNKEQRALTDELYQSMKKYVDKFPSAKCKTLVFSGGVGTGKTCLASAMARAIVEKGYAVKFVSAYRVLFAHAHRPHLADCREKRAFARRYRLRYACNRRFGYGAYAQKRNGGISAFGARRKTNERTRNRYNH